MREINAQIAKSIRELEANASHILPLVAERATLEGELTQLDAVREKLRGLARIEGADSEAFNRAHVLKALRDRELTALDHSRDTLRDFAVMIRDLLGNSEAEATSFFEEDMMSGPNGKLLASTVSVVRDAANFAEQRLKEAADHLEQTDTAIAEKRVGLEKVHAMQELSFRKSIERQQQNQAQSAERAKLEKQQNELMFKQRRLKDIVEQIKAQTKQRQLLLAKLSDERDRRFAIRDSVAKMLNAQLMPYIRVGVDQSADQEAFRRCLESNLRGASIHHISVATSISAAMSPHELGDMVRRGIAGALAKSASITPQVVAVEIDVPQVLTAPVSRYHFTMVLTNLIKNGIEAHAVSASEFGQGKVTVRARTDGEWITITVEDTGRGIAPGDLNRLQEFIPGGSTKHRTGSSGYGLPICRRYVEAHHGTLHIESKEDQGTLVTIRIPAVNNYNAET